jgi:propionyl-CoA carboxylase alpha chain
MLGLLRAGLPRFVAPLAARGVVYNGEELFDKILVANRGEIACRVMKTCKKMGIKTVAVHSDPDCDALHVRTADEAVSLGGMTSAESYLIIDKIIDACKSTGAQAVHPGYGFLSENAEFSKRLAAEGITFIGPDNYAIGCMGDKIESKQIALKANVNTIPGYVGEVDTDEDVIRISNEIGYPVMIKASAGGGGKGMRVAYDDEDAKEGFRFSKNEALSSFGDDRIFIEKYIEEPRHIEIQVLVDKHGNGVPFPERECSIQRRNQKVVEESPSVLLDDATRVAMGEQAIMLSHAVDYHSAGTVEFLCDKHKNFYFLEMNTRLQVEHPVTEYITGVDLVEQMIRVAAGYELPKELVEGPRPLPIKGHAIECRVYAEDPLRNFLPSTGRLHTYWEPAGTVEEGVRVDTGVTEGTDISMFYDPMICKLVTWAEDRDKCIAKMITALDNYVIRGVNHNGSFVRDVCAKERFVSGAITTKFIEEEYPDGFGGIKLEAKQMAEAMAVAGMLTTHHEELRGTVKDALLSYEPPVHSVLFAEAKGQQFKLDYTQPERVLVTEVTEGAEGASCEVAVDSFNWELNSPLVFAGLNGTPQTIQYMNSLPEGHSIVFEGCALEVAVRTPRAHELAKHMIPKPEIDLSRVLLSPMPGALISVNCEEGDIVEAGQEIAVVEAMKMQNILRCEKRARVVRVAAKPGDSLAVDELIVAFEPVDATPKEE